MGRCAGGELIMPIKGGKMNKDLELIRKILLHVEKQAVGQAVTSMEFDDYDDPTIGEHVRLLEECGYIEVEVCLVVNELGIEIVNDYCISRLLNPGHDFIANAKTESVWRNAMNLIREKGMNTSMAVIQDLLVQLSLKQLRLNLLD
jgi:DNA-binding transcriptional ArsR family regulator